MLVIYLCKGFMKYIPLFSSPNYYYSKKGQISYFDTGIVVRDSRLMFLITTFAIIDFSSRFNFEG